MEKKAYILCANSDKSFVYGILRVDKDIKETEVQNAVCLARNKAMDKDLWCVEDAIDLLPEDWNATLEDVTTIFV